MGSTTTSLNKADSLSKAEKKGKKITAFDFSLHSDFLSQTRTRKKSI